METIEFLKEYNRMCTMYKSCRGCPLEMDQCAGFCDEMSEKQIINMMEKTEQWSKEYHVITNAQKFKEVFGVLPTDYVMGRSRETWWDKPYKEPEKGA